MGEPSGTADTSAEDRQFFEDMADALYLWRCLEFDAKLDYADACYLRKQKSKMKKVTFSNEVTVIGVSRTGEKRVTFSDDVEVISYDEKLDASKQRLAFADKATVIPFEDKQCVPYKKDTKTSSTHRCVQGDPSVMNRASFLLWPPEYAMDYNDLNVALIARVVNFDPGEFAPMSIMAKFSLPEIDMSPRLTVLVGSEKVPFSIPTNMARHASPFFESVLDSLSEDGDSPTSKPLELAVACPESMENLIHWMITGRVYVPGRNPRNGRMMHLGARERILPVMRLYVLAEALLITGLQSACLEQVQHRVKAQRDRRFQATISPTVLEWFLAKTSPKPELTSMLGQWLGKSLYTWGKEYPRYREIFARHPNLEESVYSEAKILFGEDIGNYSLDSDSSDDSSSSEDEGHNDERARIRRALRKYMRVVYEVHKDARKDDWEKCDAAQTAQEETDED